MQKFLQQNPDGVSDSVLSTRHTDLVGKSFAIYNSKSKLGGETMDAKFNEEFTTESDRLFDTYKSINHTNVKAGENLKMAQEQFEREVKAQHKRAQEQEEKHARQRKKMGADIAAGKKDRDDLRDMMRAQEAEQKRLRKEAKEMERKFQKQLDLERAATRRKHRNILVEIIRVVASVFIPGLGRL